MYIYNQQFFNVEIYKWKIIIPKIVQSFLAGSMLLIWDWEIMPAYAASIQ